MINNFNWMEKEEIEKLKNRINSEYEWEMIYNDNGIKIYQIYENEIDIIKVESLFEIEPQILNEISKDDLFLLSSLDDLFIEKKEIQKFEENQDINYYSFNSPITFVSPRDFIIERKFLNNENEFIIKLNSINIQEYPQRDGFVRGNLIELICLITKHENGSIHHLIGQVDLGGYIPRFLVNMTIKSLIPKIISTFRSTFLKYK